jgi:hypothetical protein
MQDYTADSIKSLEGFKRSWWEEAQARRRTHSSLLRPTMRAPGSQMWWSWNPRRKVDPVDVMLRGPELPTGACVVKQIGATTRGSRPNWSRSGKTACASAGPIRPYLGRRIHHGCRRAPISPRACNEAKAQSRISRVLSTR